MQHRVIIILLGICLILIVDINAFFECQFDVVKPNIITEANVQYAKDFKRVKRNAARIDDLFRPIRLKTYFFNFTDISRVEQVRLKGVINDVVLITEQLFSGNYC